MLYLYIYCDAVRCRSKDYILKNIITYSKVRTHTFKLWCADALVGINKIPTGGVVLAGSRQTLVVLLLTVQAVVTFIRHTDTNES